MDRSGSDKPTYWRAPHQQPTSRLVWLVPGLLLLVLLTVGLVVRFTWNAPAVPPPEPEPGPPIAPKATASLPEKEASAPKKEEPPVLPTVDCYGDPLPDRALARMGSIRFLSGRVRDKAEGFNDGAQARMAFSPDGRFLAANTDGPLVIWDRDGQRHAEIELPEDETAIGELVFSPDSRLLLTGHYGQTVIAWEVDTGRMVWERDFSNYPPFIESAAFSPDGSQIAVVVRGKTQGIAILETATGKVLREMANDYTASAEWFPDGKRLLAACTSRASVIPLEDPSKAVVTKLSTKEHSFPFRLADEGRLMVLQDKDCYVRVFDTGDFKQVLEVYRQFKIRGFDLDGSRKTLFVFIGEDRHKKRIDVVLVYDLPSRKMIRALEIVQPNYIRVGRPEPKLDKELVRTMPMPLMGSCALVTPDGRTLVTADPGLNWWSALDGKPLDCRKRHDHPIKELVFDPSGQTLYALGGDIKTWDVKTGAQRATLLLTEGEKCLTRSWTLDGAHFVQSEAMALSRDGRRLAYADHHGYLSAADTGGSQFSTSAYCLAGLCPCDRSFRGNTPPFLHTFSTGPLDVVFSVGEKELITVSTDEVCSYPMKDGKALTEPRTLKTSKIGWRAGLAQSPDGRWLVANAEKVHVFDLEKMEECGDATARPSPTYYGGSVVFSPDGKELILGVDWKTDTALRWRFQEQAYPWGKPVHSDRTDPLAVSADGLWATAVRLGRKDARRTRWVYGVKVAKWAADGWLNEFQGHRFRVTALAFSPDGRYLASGDAAGEILIWDLQAPPKRGGAPVNEF